MTRTAEDFNTVAPGGYHVTTVLGGGGQAQVYAGRKQGEDQDVAIKVIQSPDALTAELFESETNAMHALGNHPNVATVHYANSFTARLSSSEAAEGVRPQQYLFSVMDRALGTVADEIQYAARTEQGRLPTRVAVQYLLDIVAGVAHTHGERPHGPQQQGIVHRDIKPANALLFPPPEQDRPLQIKLTDFGIARRGYHDPRAITQTHVGAGTILYADPRQFFEKGALFTHDQYMTAATGLHILTGSAPFSEYAHSEYAAIQAHREQPVPQRELTTPSGRTDHVAEAVQLVLIKAMSKDIAGRFDSMSELGATIVEAVHQSAAQDNQQRRVLDVSTSLGWRIPMDTQARSFTETAMNRYGIVDEPSRQLSRRGLILGGVAALAASGAGGAWLTTRETARSADDDKTKKPEATPTTYEGRLAAAFAAQPPELPPLNNVEKAATRESVDQVVRSTTERLQIWGLAKQSVSLVGALGAYNPDTAYELWQWMETVGYPNSKKEVNDLGLADPHAWAAAMLAGVKTEELTQILLSDEWKDNAQETGLATRANDVRGANRGVLGCALARLRPQDVAKMGDYYGASTTVVGFADAVALALRPTQKDAAAIFHGLGLEESHAVAATLAYKNAPVLMREIEQNKDILKIGTATFGWSLLHLLPNHPDFVAKMITSKILDPLEADQFVFSSTLETSLYCAASHPAITENTFRTRFADLPETIQAMYGLALAGYKPAITAAIAAEQPANLLLQLALKPTDESLRTKAMAELNEGLDTNPDQYGNVSFLALAFICGQQYRLRKK